MDGDGIIKPFSGVIANAWSFSLPKKSDIFAFAASSYVMLKSSEQIKPQPSCQIQIYQKMMQGYSRCKQPIVLKQSLGWGLVHVDVILPLGNPKMIHLIDFNLTFTQWKGALYTCWSPEIRMIFELSHMFWVRSLQSLSALIHAQRFDYLLDLRSLFFTWSFLMYTHIYISHGISML